MSRDKSNQPQIEELDDDQLQAVQGGLKSRLSKSGSAGLRSDTRKTLERDSEEIMAQSGDGSI